MTDLSQEVQEILHQQGGRMTPQRRLILAALQSLEGHPTAEEIFQAAAEKDPSINLSTVYRTLRWLERFDLVSTFHFHDGNHQDRYGSSAKERHFHFRCRKCGLLIEFNDPAVAKIRDRIARQYGCDVEEASLTLSGVCDACKSSS